MINALSFEQNIQLVKPGQKCKGYVVLGEILGKSGKACRACRPKGWAGARVESVFAGVGGFKEIIIKDPKCCFIIFIDIHN